MRCRSRGPALVLLLCLCLWLEQRLSSRAFSHGPRRERHEEEMMSRHEGLEHVDVAVACMLLGGVSFAMGLFYLVNSRDQNIRRISWDVISTTLAIFTAVLIFQGLDGIVVAFILKCACPHGASERQLVIVAVSILHFLCWFLIMHAVVAKLACGKNFKPDRDDDEACKDWEQQIKCWATLLSHMTAFAAIAAMCDVQQLPLFARNPYTCAVPVVLHILVLFIIFRLTDYIRKNVFGRGGGLSEQIKVWDEEGEEGENDLAAISISFLTVQVVRYAISGTMGDERGQDLTDRSTALSSILTLLGVSFFFLVALFACVRAVVLRRISRAMFTNEEVPRYHPTAAFAAMDRYLRRWRFILLDTSGMCFAWCLLYATKWTVHHAAHAYEIPLAQTETINGICLALSTSVIACLLILSINWICDHRSAHDIVTKQFRTLIRSLGILIGFGWEQSFDAGVEAMARLTEWMGQWHVLLAKFLLACAVGLVVVPAWRLHILKTVLSMESETNDSGNNSSGSNVGGCKK